MNPTKANRAERLQLLLKENAIGCEALAYCIAEEPETVEKWLSGQLFLKDGVARQIEQAFCKAQYWLDGDLVRDDNYDLFG